MSQVVTRIAPSPTGDMHIGTARTALFNWLYAKGRGGKFLIRVEDTDRERSTQTAVDKLFEGFAWLELFSDEPPVFQYGRIERHKAVVEDLLARGAAYRCWMSPDETQAEREAAKAENRRFVSPWRDRTDGDPGEPFVVRFKGPLDGDVVVRDLVQGEVRWQARHLDDLVLLRSDGNPTYNLAVVVDDHDMGVTHVIRGDDHLNNTPKQQLIYQALGWALPAFAHIPLIYGDDGKKLSKRHGATAVGEYADLGYLPEAMRNYLARLSWGHGDDELFSDEQAMAWFDVADVSKAPSRLDFDKLAHVNAHWMKLADDSRLARLTREALARRGADLWEGDDARLTRAIPYLKDRARTVVELADQAGFVLRRRPVELDERTRGLLDEAGRARLERLRRRLSLFESWDVFALEAELKAFAEDEGVGFGKIGPLVRGALTGGSPSPDLAKTLAALGMEESLGRLDDALST
ncbi:MAG: glutamate--tRNA ligase [Caulobacteraceae bacterium]|nr:glutamate--tRNA ligase [Caulobacteraceae bacterium]